MENEISAVTKIGVVLIALAVLIGLAFGIFKINKEYANDGTTDTQEGMTTLSNMVYKAYDQTEISGDKLTSAIDTFKNKNFSILIATQSWIDCSESVMYNQGLGNLTTDNICDKGSGFTTAYKNNNNDVPTVFAYLDRAYTETQTTIASNENYTNMTYINYGNLLGSNASVKGIRTKTYTWKGYSYYPVVIYFNNGSYVSEYGYVLASDGNYLVNNTIANLSKVGRTEYIPSTAKFRSYLVKDTSGTIIGIAASQIS